MTLMTAQEMEQDVFTVIGLNRILLELYYLKKLL